MFSLTGRPVDFNSQTPLTKHIKKSDEVVHKNIAKKSHCYEKCTSPTPNLDSGVFTCLTPGYYTVSFSAYGLVGPNYDYIDMYLYKNGIQIPESGWYFGGASSASDANDAGVVGSRIVVSNISECFLNFGGFPEC